MGEFRLWAPGPSLWSGPGRLESPISCEGAPQLLIQRRDLEFRLYSTLQPRGLWKMSPQERVRGPQLLVTNFRGAGNLQAFRISMGFGFRSRASRGFVDEGLRVGLVRVLRPTPADFSEVLHSLLRPQICCAPPSSSSVFHGLSSARARIQIQCRFRASSPLTGRS